MLAGIVRFFDPIKGFGYIGLRGEGPDVYVNHRAIPGKGFRCLVAGEHVQVELDPHDSKVAIAVFPEKDRQRGTVVEFDHYKGYGSIQPRDGTERLFVHHSAILGPGPRNVLEPGEEVEFEINNGPRGLCAISVKRLDPRPPLARFAFLGRDSKWLAELAILAEPEPWDFRHSQVPTNSILRSYVYYTFARAQQLSEISFDSSGTHSACFNTGLVDRSFEEQILALFGPNHISERVGTPWRLLGFVKESDRRLLSSITQLPRPVRYAVDPYQLFFNADLPMQVDVDHIVGENLQRFPMPLRHNPQRARQALETAAARARKEAQRHYNVAVPQFYRGSIQHLLPLYLQSRENAELALAVSRISDQSRADTVLTLEMAYSNARLIARPCSRWLHPEQSN